MSRIGKLPIFIPSGVELKVLDTHLEISGPKGHLKTDRHPAISYEVQDKSVYVKCSDDSIVARSQHGLRRTLLNNCILGVSKGFEKTLEVLGVGYKVAVKGNSLELALGFSHPVIIDLPEGISARTEGNKLILMGINKELVGSVAASIRQLRKPEPYKGKGIKYANEQIRRKVGKSGGKK